MTKPLLYDGCSGAGGAAKGYQRAGFRVIGIDINPQSHYCGDGFIQMDILAFLRRYLAGEFERASAIHTSVPCQKYSKTQRIHGNEYPDLIAPTRELLIKTGLPYVMENVPEAPLNNPTILNGLMFGLKVVRNRAFETNWFLMAPPEPENVKVYTNSSRGYSSHANGATHITVAGNNYNPDDGRAAMGIDWMTRDELSEAIPPAYTEFIGRQLMAVIDTTRPGDRAGG